MSAIIKIDFLYPIIEEFVEEKGIEKNIIIQGILESLEEFYSIKYKNQSIIVKYNKKQEEILIGKNLLVVENVMNQESEISIKKAKKSDSSIHLGDYFFTLLEDKLSRVEIIKIKQSLLNKIKSIEMQIISKEFNDKINTILSGLVHKIDSRGISILIQGYNAYLPKSNQIPEEKIILNTNIKVLIKEINKDAKNFDEIIILDRSSSLFVEKLLELEIPEIFDKLITIEKVARIPGYKSKVLLQSNSKELSLNIIGTCIGVSGSRIKPILKEISAEKIDFIKAAKDNNIENVIIESLKPGKVNFVEIKDNKAFVDVNKDERAAVIGRYGKNIALASEITGYNIEIIDRNE